MRLALDTNRYTDLCREVEDVMTLVEADSFHDGDSLPKASRRLFRPAELVANLVGRAFRLDNFVANSSRRHLRLAVLVANLPGQRVRPARQVANLPKFATCPKRFATCPARLRTKLAKFAI